MGVTVVLLAAGYATRLYPLTKDKPKALLSLDSGVILDQVVSSLKDVPDLRQSFLVTNHRFAEQFRQWQHNHRLPIRVIDDGTETVEARLGAIRDLELVWKQTDQKDDVLVLGTDNLFRWSLASFVKEAQKHRPHPSVALWQAPSRADARQFGVVIRDSTCRVTRFVEKSPDPPSAEVSLCVYYFPAAICGKIRQFIESGENTDAPGHFIAWLSRTGSVYGIMMPGEWHDIGTKEEYQAVLSNWKQGRSSE